MFTIKYEVKLLEELTRLSHISNTRAATIHRCMGVHGAPNHSRNPKFRDHCSSASATSIRTSDASVLQVKFLNPSEVKDLCEMSLSSSGF